MKTLSWQISVYVDSLPRMREAVGVGDFGRKKAGEDAEDSEGDSPTSTEAKPMRLEDT